MRNPLRLAVVAAVLFTSAPAAAYEVADHTDVYAYFKQWYALSEGMPEAKGNLQSPSRDEAVDEASGFRFAAVRAGIRTRTKDNRFGFEAQLRLERDPQLLECEGRVTFAPWLSLHAGQMKIPSVYENLMSDTGIDFMVRSQMASAAADYALSRTTYASSLFYGNLSQLRDLGIAAKGEVKLGPVPVRYFGMVGNGLGANLYIGGNSGKEYVITNSPGDVYLGLRTEVDPWPGVLRLGGFASHNRHDNMLFNSGRAVIDVHRHAWGTDLQVDLARSGMRASGAYSRGTTLDDFDDNGKKDLMWSGWEWRVVWRLNPVLRLLAPCRMLEAHAFEIGFRHDELSTESDESGVAVRRTANTVGANYLYRSWLKVQMNYVQRRTDDPFEPDLAGNAWLMSLQVKI